jgi:hypothetical protein
MGVLPACSLRSKDLDKAARDDLAEDISSGKPVFEGSHFHKIRDLELEAYSSEKAAALFETFRKNGTWQCPTLTTNHNFAFVDDPSLKKDARLRYMPARIRSYRERNFEPGADPGNLPGNPDDFTFYHKEFKKQLEVVGAMQRSGVGIIAGTDVIYFFCFPGFSLHDELALLVQAGLTPREALQTATLNPARFLGIEKDFGAIEKGRMADLVLLSANPLEDITNTKKIEAVVFGGRYFPKPQLEEMLANIEALAAKQSIADELFILIMDKGLDVALKRYYELKSAASEDYDFGERELDDLGFRLLGNKRPDEAIRILELNAEVYPISWYVYDSLGDVYMRTGNRERAIKNYRRSLELNSKNTNATDKLMQLHAR